MSVSQRIDTYWHTTYGDRLPVAHHLRSDWPDRWFRFHTLPESKRYPENEAEYQTILTRHNSVLGELSSPRAPLVLVTTGYSSSVDPIRDNQQLDELDSSPEYWRTIAIHGLEDDPEPNYWHLYLSAWSWSPSVFDQIFRLVADDAVANLMIISTSNHWVYHPYDGGADIILRTLLERERVKAEFNPWLSRHPEGL